jgi:dTDP-4-dehydrorhamnose reductase
LSFKILLLGASGLLGSQMDIACKNEKYFVLCPNHQTLDLENPKQLNQYFDEHPVDIVINCAAWSRVDDCEKPDLYPQSQCINGTAVGWLADICMRKDILLIHFSTDYVFNGRKQGYYNETDSVDPVNAYGRTKLMGEQQLMQTHSKYYLIRTSWLFGCGGNNFVKTIVHLLKTRPQIQVVNDQWGSPTATVDLAVWTMRFLKEKPPFGIYHFSNSGYTNWYEFAREIQNQICEFQAEIQPISSALFKRPAARPANSQFDLSKLQKVFHDSPRHWRAALSDYLSKEDFH